MTHHESNPERKTTWCTPDWIIKDFGPFYLDPCPNLDEPHRCAMFFMHEGLGPGNWFAPHGKIIFVNPPFGKGVDRWLKKASNAKGNCLVLLPARVETKWFHDWVWGKAWSVLFFNKRVQYVDPATMEVKGGAGFPSCMVAYGQHADCRLKEWDGTHGKVVEV